MSESLIAVIVGGLIAIVAGIAAPIVQHYLLGRTRKEDSRRANVHALIVALHELDDWLDRYRRIYTNGEACELGLSPEATVEALARVHFPEQVQALQALTFTISLHKKWCMDRNAERIARTPLNLADWKITTENYQLARANLIAAVTGGEQLTPERVFGRVTAGEKPGSH